MMKKNIIFWILGAIAVVALGVVLVSNKKDEVTASPTPSPALTSSPQATPSGFPISSPSTAPTKTAIPKPGIKAEEVQDYNYWFNQLDHQSRVLAIYDECSYIVPSNVTYKNNTLVMLDNTRSNQAHVLKIGNIEYTLAAGAWNTVTLSSQTLPAKMQIFCKGIELGQIDLE